MDLVSASIIATLLAGLVVASGVLFVVVINLIGRVKALETAGDETA